MMIITIPTIIWGILCLTGQTDRPEYSFIALTENREITAKPSDIFDTASWEMYYNDRLPFRNVIINFDNNLESGLEKRYRSTVMPVLSKVFAPKKRAPLEPSVASLSFDQAEPIPTPELKEENVDEKIHTHEWEAIDTREASYTDFGRTLYECRICGKRKWDDFKDKLIDETYQPLIYAANDVFFGRYDWLFYSNVNVIEYFEGKMIMSDSEKEKVLSEMERLQSECDKLGIKLVFMIAPNREQIYPEYMPTLNVKDGVKREPDLVDYVRSNSDINIFYPLNELQRAKIFYDTCYRYDSHWNHWGAFVGTEALYDALGMETVAPESVPVDEEYTTMSGLIASGALNPADYEPAKDYLVHYREEADSYALDGLQDIRTGYTEYYEAAATAPICDKRIAIIGDSFRVSMFRYIQKDFASSVSIQKETILASEKFGPEMLDKVIAGVKSSDILVLETVERFDNDYFTMISLLADHLGD